MAKDAGLEGCWRSFTARRKRKRLRLNLLPELTDEEIQGIDVLTIEDAVKVLWAHGIYAESAMGCTGPVIKYHLASC